MFNCTLPFVQNYPFLSIIQKCYVKQIYTENFYTTEYSCNMDCRIVVFIGLLTIYIHGTPSNFESSFHPDNDKPRQDPAWCRARATCPVQRRGSSTEVTSSPATPSPPTRWRPALHCKRCLTRPILRLPLITVRKSLSYVNH